MPPLQVASLALAALLVPRGLEQGSSDLSLTDCRALAEEARLEADPETRLELWDEAARAFRALLDRSASSAPSREAALAYLQLALHYSRDLDTLLATTPAVRDAQELRARRTEILTDGLKRTAVLEQGHARSGLTRAEELAHGRLVLDRAELLIALGAQPPDEAPAHSSAEGALEALRLEAGATSGLGLSATLSLAKLKLIQGRFSEAARLAEVVVATAMPLDSERADWRALSFEAKAERFRLVELGLPCLLESHAAAGDVRAACRWALAFHDGWKREGFTLSALGYVALLSAARTLLDAGETVDASHPGALRWSEEEDMGSSSAAADSDAPGVLGAADFALRIAFDVSDANRGNVLESRARELVAQALRRQDLALSPGVRFEAGRREHEAQDFARAVEELDGFVRALAARDEATRREYGPRAAWLLGDSYSKLRRPLEAALAFRAGATTFGGEPELRERLARAFHAHVLEAQRTSDDASVAALLVEAEELVLLAGGPADDVHWRRAERAYEAGDYARAYDGYGRVSSAAPEHEEAVVKAGLCLYKQRDLAGAERELRAYLHAFAPRSDAAHSAGAARAQATYTLGKMAFDAHDHEQVIALLASYATEFPHPEEYALNALFMLVIAHVAREDLAAAKLALAPMQERFGAHALSNRAAASLFQALRAEHEAAELAGDGARATELELDMAFALRVANRSAPEPVFEHLRLESSLRLRLLDWVGAEEVLRATLEHLAGRAERAAELERFVRADLAAALLGQRRAREAFELLDPLVPNHTGDADSTRMPDPSVVRDWCRSVSGWLEGDGVGDVEVSGVGGAANLARAVELYGELIRLQGASGGRDGGTRTCTWYQLQLERMWALRRWSEVEPARKGEAERLLEDLCAYLGDPELGEVARSCGDEVVRLRLLGLRRAR